MKRKQRCVSWNVLYSGWLSETWSWTRSSRDRARVFCGRAGGHYENRVWLQRPLLTWTREQQQQNINVFRFKNDNKSPEVEIVNRRAEIAVNLLGQCSKNTPISAIIFVINVSFSCTWNWIVINQPEFKLQFVPPNWENCLWLCDNLRSLNILSYYVQSCSHPYNSDR